MAVDDTVAALRQTVTSGESAKAKFEQAQEALREAGQLLAQVTQGTVDPVVGQALGGFEQAAQDIAALNELVARACETAEAYASSLAGDGQDQAAPAPPGKKAAPEDPVEKARRELPTRGAGRGVKTEGRWFAPGRTVSPVVSGRDDYTNQVNDVLKEAGCPYEPVTAAADVELKIAAEMREKGITEATVVINNVPCEGPASCDTLLGVVLPEDSSLTVHGTGGFKKTYRGGANPWRR